MSTFAAVVTSASKARRCRRPPPSLPRCRVPSTPVRSVPGRGQVDDQHPLGADGPGEPGQRALEREPPAVDEEHPVAEALDVAHVVGGQQQRRPVLAPLGDEELAQPLLGEHVEPDRRLVEDHQAGGVQQGGRDLGAHPLAERELPDRGRPELAHLEALDQLVGAGRARGPGPGRGWRRGSGTTPGRAGPTTAASAARRRRRPRGPAACGRGRAGSRRCGRSRRWARGCRPAS